MADAPHLTGWTHATAAYTLLHLLLSLLLLARTAASPTSEPVVRATLQLITSVSLLPSIPATRLPTTPAYGTGRLRWPVLAAFLIALTLLIDAALRILAAAHVLLYRLHVRLPTHIAPLVLAQSALDLLAVVVFRTAGPVPGLTVPAPMRHLLMDAAAFPPTIMPSIMSVASSLIRMQRTTSISKRRPYEPRGPHAAQAPTPALCALLIHAVTSLAARFVDAVALLLSQSSIVTSVLDVAAALFTFSVAYPLLSLMVRILMQATPHSLVNIVQTKRAAIVALDGVVSVSNVHVWEETAGVYIGTLSITIKSSASANTVLKAALAAFDGVVDDLTVQVETWQESLPCLHDPMHDSIVDAERVGGDV